MNDLRIKVILQMHSILLMNTRGSSLAMDRSNDQRPRNAPAGGSGLDASGGRLVLVALLAMSWNLRAAFRSSLLEFCRARSRSRSRST